MRYSENFQGLFSCQTQDRLMQLRTIVKNKKNRMIEIVKKKAEE